MAFGVGLVFTSLFCLVTAQVTIKLLFTKLGVISLDASLIGYIFKALQQPLLWLGGGTLILGALLWYTALSRLPLSVAYPITALSYPLIALASWMVLGESISTLTLIGAVLILAGVILSFLEVSV